MRHAHGTDVADQELPCGPEFLPQGLTGCGGGRCKEICFDTVFDDGNFFTRNTPVLHEIFLERWSYNHDEVGTIVEKLGYRRQSTVQKRSVMADTDGG